MGANLFTNYGEAVAMILFGIGFGNLLLQSNLIKKIIGLNIMDTAVYLFLAALPFKPELIIPANRQSKMDIAGKFCTKSIYSPSFFNLMEISSRSSV